MKRVMIIIGAVAVLLAAIGLSRRPVDCIPTVGILQTASHPALDLVRDSFIATLQERMGDRVRIRVQNAEGLMPHVQSIAQSFHNDTSVKAVFSIASPATQMMAQVDKEKPIVFAAVTDPHALGVLEANRNITGCRDMVEAGKTVEAIQQLVPEAKTVALLFSPGEVNSVAMVKRFKRELERHGLQYVEVGIHQESEVVSAVSIASGKADVILAPTDNTVAATIQLLAREALKHGTPLIVSDNLLVEKGALAAYGVDYAASGRNAALMMERLLTGEVTPEEIPLQDPEGNRLVINAEILEALGLERNTGI